MTLVDPTSRWLVVALLAAAVAVSVVGPIVLAGATVAIALTVAALRRPFWGLVALLACATVIGPGLAVAAVGARVRVIDVVLLICVLTLLPRLASRLPASGTRSAVIMVLVVVALVALGLDNGSAHIRADLYRLMFLPITWLLASDVAAGPDRRHLPNVVVILVALTALKAIALGLAPRSLDGPFSVWQAWSFATTTGWRVILVGGDSLLLVAPAFLLVTSGLATSSWRRSALVSTLALVALVYSQTRTTIALSIFGFVLGLFIGAAGVGDRRGALRRSAAIVATGAAVLVIVSLMRPGLVFHTAERAFIRFDAAATGPYGSPESSLAGRQREKELALDTLTGASLWTGRGLGASYVEPWRGKRTVWSHNLGVWVLLKAGIVGVLGAAAVALRLGLSTWSRSRKRLLAPDQLGAAIALAVLFGASPILNRIVTVEGMVLGAFFFAVLLISQSAATATTTPLEVQRS